MLKDPALRPRRVGFRLFCDDQSRLPSGRRLDESAKRVMRLRRPLLLKDY